jgi:tetratricopeptide (TPR) repeat protein
MAAVRLSFRERRRRVAVGFFVVLLFMAYEEASGWNLISRSRNSLVISPSQSSSSIRQLFPHHKLSFAARPLLVSTTPHNHNHQPPTSAMSSNTPLSESNNNNHDKSSSSSPRRPRGDGSSSSKTNRRKRYYKKKGGIKSMFQEAKKMERQGLWNEASSLYSKILEKAPKDAHSHLALARLEARRESKKMAPSTSSTAPLSATIRSSATDNNQHHDQQQQTRAQLAFATGTTHCPNSVHLWQAWAVYEDYRGHSERARELFEEALALDPQNPYVCHAFGLYHKRQGELVRATELFGAALATNSTAALVCSLGELWISQKRLQETRDLYAQHLKKLTKEKDRIEVYLASAWLEERYFQDFERAKTLLQLALELSPGSSLANVALARLEGRIDQRKPDGSQKGDRVTAKRLADACKEVEKKDKLPSDPTDGRIYNALAQIEVKAKRFRNAQQVLERGIQMYPKDHAVRAKMNNGNYSTLRHPRLCQYSGCSYSYSSLLYFCIVMLHFVTVVSSSRKGRRTCGQLYCCKATVQRESSVGTLCRDIGGLCHAGISASSKIAASQFCAC